MSAMYRLKAYFGMVPADEMDFVDDRDSYGGPRAGYEGRRSDRWASGGGRFSDADDYGEYAPESAAPFDEGWGAARRGKPPVRRAVDGTRCAPIGTRWDFPDMVRGRSRAVR